ncbi:MAG: Na(+)-translocating NADH-quinone reductase subunit A [Chitinophagales bacterium]|nr:Na(+)-translocating NADH-quinone reductase subunit A [Chitinophagales bacterium]
MVLVVFLFFVFGDHLIKDSARVAGYGNKANTFGVLPNKEEVSNIIHHKHAGANKVHKLEKGFDVKIKGKAAKVIEHYDPATYAVKPYDFKGLQPIPKMSVEVGTEVKAGDKLFYDKNYPDIFFTAPVSGEIAEIRRGDKRAIEEIVILSDKRKEFKQFPKLDITTAPRSEIVSLLAESGAWSSFIERPFGLVAKLERVPKSIHISTFDTSPLAPDYAFIMKDRGTHFKKGVEVLKRLTDGKVHINLNAKKKPLPFYSEIKDIQLNWFEGKHPAGLPGIQIHHTDPIDKGDTVWTISPMDTAVIGKLFSEGIYDPERIVAVAGPQVNTPKYYKTYLSANLSGLMSSVKKEGTRFISGNVLTGKQVDPEKGHVGYYDHLISCIKEGDFYELFGWLIPSYPRPSASVTFPWTLFPFEEFDVNTNTHGEERAFVVTGEYEAVLPMDIYPVHLLKAILSRDFDQMEGLGIYEVIEEDFAICEFVCTSKQPAMAILRDGLNYMKEQS